MAKRNKRKRKSGTHPKIQSRTKPSEKWKKRLKRLRLGGIRVWEGLKTLWRRAVLEERPLRRRAILVFSPVLLFSFMFMFWGAMNAMVINYATGVVAISPRDVFLPLFIIFLAVTVAGAGLLLLLRGSFLDLAVGLVFALAVGGYIQLMFLNRVLDLVGDEELYFTTGQIAVNLAVWILVAAAVLVLRLVKKSLWPRVVVGASALLFVMQLASFFVIVPDIRQSEGTRINTGYYLSIENEFVLSDNENTIVFLLDRLTSSNFQQALDIFPHLPPMFRDFTNFTNSATLYDGTNWAMPYLLTRQRYDYTIPRREHLENIWLNPETLSFYDSLQRAGIGFHLFASPGNFIHSRQQLYGIADNLVYGDLGYTDTRILVREMLGLSAFLHSPFMIKSYFEPLDGSFHNVIVHPTAYVRCDPSTYQRLTNTRLSTQSTHNMFVFYHMTGAHGGIGIQMDEFANPVPEALPHYRRAAGALWIVGEYLNQMRELGIYDNANIIIMADNGYFSRPNVAFLVKRAGVSRENIGVSDAPISHEDFWPTLVELMGLDVDFGRSVFDIPEDYIRERGLTVPIGYPDLPNTHLTRNAFAVFSYTGHVNDISSLGGGRQQQPGLVERNPHIRLIPIAD